MRTEPTLQFLCILDILKIDFLNKIANFLNKITSIFGTTVSSKFSCCKCYKEKNQ